MSGLIADNKLHDNIQSDDHIKHSLLEKGSPLKEYSLAEKFDLPHKANGSLQSKIDNLFIGDSALAQNIKQMIILSAGSSCPILITGPSGSGKEVAAKAIHALSSRREKPLISINCGAIPHELIEAELFGHSKGAFTGAHKDHIGLFEQAHGGTLFLDEIGDMPTNLQVRLLRVLEDGIIRSIGGTEKTLNVRIIAATNKEFGRSIASGEFREDLYYRLSVLSIDMPSLKQRRDDIIDLTQYFMGQTSHSQITISDAGWDILLRHDWPGNIRELRNWVSRATLFNNGDDIDAARVQTLITMGKPYSISYQETAYYDKLHYEQPSAAIQSKVEDSKLTEGFDLRAHIMNEEKKFMRMALTQSKGIIARAAASLAMKRTTFVEKMKRHDIIA